jgi:glycosyltransferase involved in cell wall biosynthesis
MKELDHPRWTICIATVGERQDRFLPLVNKILKQTDPYKGNVQVLVYWNNFEFPLGEIRQALIENATGDYVSFVDDDDDVPDYYVDEVMKALETSPDYVGWQLQVWQDGQKMKPTYHSLRYADWSEDENGWYRNVSHLNPIMRGLALKAGFQVENGSPEDAPWAVRVAPLVKTEVYIDKIMYFYRHSSEDSVWRGHEIYTQVHYRPQVMHPNLSFYSKYSGLTKQQVKESFYNVGYYQRDIPENWFRKYGLLRPDELAAVCYAFGQGFTRKNIDTPRDPGVIYSIGCGEGILEKKLEDMGCEVYGVDPAPGAKELYQGKHLLNEYPGGGGTIIFCESIEHLYKDQFKAIWEKIPSGARVIIVNWLDFHPIEPDTTGFDHVTLVDDDYFYDIAYGQRVIFQRGSHLVIEKVA